MTIPALLCRILGGHRYDVYEFHYSKGNTVTRKGMWCNRCRAFIH